MEEEGGDEEDGESGGTSMEGKSGTTQVTAKVVDTPEIKRAREQVDRLKRDLVEMEKEHYRLLNSAISQGSATANVKLAAVEPKLRSKIQASAVALDDIKVKVSFQTLVYELERIYTYLLGELGNPAVTGYIPLQDRLNVAEFGLLESQIDSFNRQFLEDENVDEDVLVVVFEQLTDFKRRLGIDYYVAGLSFDREAIGQWLGELWIKTKKGLAFYVKGVRLFWNDIVFCLRLINRAAQGYTLKPREVRTIRYVCKLSCRLGSANGNSGRHNRGSLFLAFQPNLQRRNNFHSICDHPVDPFITHWSRPCLWCHSEVLSRLLSELLYGTTAKFVTAVRNSRVLGDDHQRNMARKSLTAYGSDPVRDCQRVPHTLFQNSCGDHGRIQEQ